MVVHLCCNPLPTRSTPLWGGPQAGCSLVRILTTYHLGRATSCLARKVWKRGPKQNCSEGLYHCVELNFCSQEGERLNGGPNKAIPIAVCFLETSSNILAVVQKTVATWPLCKWNQRLKPVQPLLFELSRTHNMGLSQHEGTQKMVAFLLSC